MTIYSLHPEIQFKIVFHSGDPKLPLTRAELRQMCLEAARRANEAGKKTVN